MDAPAAGFPHESFAHACCFDRDALGAVCASCLFACWFATFMNDSGFAAPEKGKNSTLSKVMSYFSSPH